MKKKLYHKPTMNIVEVQQQLPLAASGLESKRNGYGAATEEEW